MSFTWKRQTRTYDIDGDSTDNSIETLSAPLFVYSTDNLFTTYNENDVPMAIGEYLWKYERFRLDGAGNPIGSNILEYRITKTGDTEVEHQKLEKRTIEGGTWETIYDQDVPDNPEVGGLNVTITYIDGGNGFRGSYRLELSYYENGILQGSPEVAGTFDVRTFEARNFKAECPADPQEGEILLTADFYTYPAPGDSPLFPYGWTPDSDVAWKLDITSTTGTLSPISNTSSLLSGAPESDGRVASMSYLWDGKNSNGKFSREEAKLEMKALCDAPGPGNTRNNRESGATCFLRCARGENLVNRFFRLFNEGALAQLSLLYLSFDHCRPPQSMGYGWSSDASTRIKELTGGDLVFRSAGGMVRRWTPGGGGYVPVHPDTYMDIEKDMGSTSARYVLTFQKDHSVMRFDDDGRLTEEEDALGNTVSYTYSGSDLTEISDDRGRTVYFDYGSRGDGQPESIRAMHPTTGRQIQLQYYSSSHSVSPDRLFRTIDPEGETTEYEYNELGLLTKMTEVRPIIGDYVVEYAYNLQGRLSSEIVNDEVATYYDYLSRYYENGTSTHDMTLTVYDLTETNPEQQYPLRTTLYRNDQNGSLILIQEGEEIAQS